jgi:transposase
MPAILEDAEQNISPRMRTLLARVWQEWKQLEIDIADASDEIERIANEDAGCKRLRQIPGVGPLVSTATVAAISNGATFRKGRDFAAWLGLVLRQYSTGGKAKLYGISKRGNICLVPWWAKTLPLSGRDVIARNRIVASHAVKMFFDNRPFTRQSVTPAHS